MTEELLEGLTERLARKLGLSEPEEDELLLLQDELEAAEGEVLLYLGREALDERFAPYVVALAALYYQRDAQETGGLKSYSYTEGQVSESSTYLTEAEYRGGIEEVLHALARYRSVPC